MWATSCTHGYLVPFWWECRLTKHHWNPCWPHLFNLNICILKNITKNMPRPWKQWRWSLPHGSFRIEGPVWWVLSSPGSSKGQWFFCPMTWSVSGFRLFSNPTIPSDWTVGTLENQSVGREKSTQNTGVRKVRSEKNTFLTHFAFPRHQWRRGHMVTCSCKKAGGWFSPVFFL